MSAITSNNSPSILRLELHHTAEQTEQAEAVLASLPSDVSLTLIESEASEISRAMKAAGGVPEAEYAERVIFSLKGGQAYIPYSTSYVIPNSGGKRLGCARSRAGRIFLQRIDAELASLSGQKEERRPVARRWSEKQVSLSLDPSLTSEEKATWQSAAALWSNVDGSSLKINIVDPTQVAQIQVVAAQNMTFDPNVSAYKSVGESPLCLSQLALKELLAVECKKAGMEQRELAPAFVCRVLGKAVGLWEFCPGTALMKQLPDDTWPREMVMRKTSILTDLSFWDKYALRIRYPSGGEPVGLAAEGGYIDNKAYNGQGYLLSE